MSSEHSRIVRMCLIALFGALSFVLTAFCQIPYAGGAGYFNFGDVVALFASMALGPIEGMAIGIIGGAFGDLFLGYAAFAPFTLLAKGLMGLLSGLVFHLLRKQKIWRFIAPYLGSILMILVYMIAYMVIYGKGVYLSSAFDCVQGAVCSSLSIPLYLVMEKTGLLKRFNPETNS